MDLPLMNNDSYSASDSPDTAPHVAPWYNGILIGGYVVIIVVGITANLLVMLVTIFGQRNSKNAAIQTINTYLINMASADLLYIFGGIFWALSNYNMKGWLFGEVGCRTIIGLDVICMYASSYTLIAMTLDRYLVIRNPVNFLRFRNVSVAKKITTFIWLSGLGLALPLIIGLREIAVNIHGKTKMFCGGFIFGNQALARYYISVCVITFVIPSIAMIVIYSMMFKLILPLTNSSPTKPEERVYRQLKKSSAQIAKIIFLIVAVFWLCYIPFWLNYILIIYAPNIGRKTKSTMSLITLLLSYLNSMVNPFLYTLMPERYNMWAKLRTIKSSIGYKVAQKESFF